ncbi:MAG: hypothetical protein ABWK01_01700 [Infirmifilum sp.]
MKTTVKVERGVAEELKKLKRKLGLRSINDVLVHLIREHRLRGLDSMFGIDRGRISSFTEADRIELRD